MTSDNGGLADNLQQNKNIDLVIQVIKFIILLIKAPMHFKSKSLFLKIISLSLFAISLGYLEAAVVIYLRMQYFSNRFYLPLNNVMPNNVLLIEIFREISTIAILLSVAALSMKKFIERFASFLFIFALWDIFYYIFLKIILGWPVYTLDKDILLLIPIPWIAPVLAPIIVSVTFIILSMSIYYLSHKDSAFNNLGKMEWTFFSLGSFLIFCSFMTEYLFYRFENLDLIKKIINLTSTFNSNILQWTIFIVGEFFLISVIILLLIRKRH